MEPWFFETDIEHKVRKELQDRGLRLGIDFVIQYPLKFSFIVDIAFPETKLAVELDGDFIHSRRKNRKRDKMKDSILTKEGWSVLRILGSEIQKDVSACVDYIFNELQKKQLFLLRKATNERFFY